MKAGCALGGFVAALAAALLAWTPAYAHKPLSALDAVRLLGEIDELQTAHGQGTRVARAYAAYELGETIRSVIEVLNRDLANRGDLGVTSERLASALKARGIDLSYWPQANRYRGYLVPYESSLELAPHGPYRADALLRLIQGRFYDGFLYDPLQPIDLDWPRLTERLAEAETFASIAPNHPESEEATFILAVEYVRAARMAPAVALARTYAKRARDALTAFTRSYPESMRTSAARMLIGAVPAVD